jgi:hypothetical protein
MGLPPRSSVTSLPRVGASDAIQRGAIVMPPLSRRGRLLAPLSYSDDRGVRRHLETPFSVSRREFMEGLGCGTACGISGIDSLNWPWRRYRRVHSLTCLLVLANGR